MAIVRALALLGFGFLGLGCTAESAEDDMATSDDAIIGGRATFAEPAVGVTTWNGATGCSATLVRKNVILLAGHCFPADRTDIAPWRFQIRKSAAESYDFDTGAGWVKGRFAGADDIALLRLEQWVPPEIAGPLPIARRWPSWGTTLRMIGFGCVDGQGTGGGVKRMLEKRYGPAWDLGWVTRASCPGDSGGALIDTSTRSILGVISGNDWAGDLFGDVVTHRDEVEREADRLAR